MRSKTDTASEEKKSVTSFIKVSYSGEHSIDPIDLLKSREGYESFKRDRDAFLEEKK